MRITPALNESSAIRHFEHSDAIEIRNGIIFHFYTGLPQTVYFDTQVFIGNRKWMMANNVRVTTEMEQNLQRYEELGQTVVLAAVDGRRD